MPFNLTLSPSQLEVVLKPGASLTQAYQVTNNSDSPITISSSIEYWTPTGSDGSVVYCGDLCPYQNSAVQFSLANANLKLDQPFTLAGHQSQQLVLKIKSNSQAVTGDYYASFFVSQLPPDTGSQNLPAQATGKIGSHLLLSLSPTDSNSGTAKINYLKTSPTLKDIFFGQINIQSEIANTSSYYFAPTGHLSITKSGKEIKKLPLAPQNILARHTRRLRCLTADPTTSQAPVSITDCIINPPFWPGIYTATLKLDAPIKSTPVSVNFFVFPYYLTAAIVILTLSTFLFWRLRFSRRSLGVGGHH